MKVCHKCGNPKIVPGRAKKRHYICARCHNAIPRNIRARTKWIRKRRETAAGRAYERAMDARRIRYNGTRYGYAQTPEQAQAIRRHIRQRMHAFKGQQARTQAEGDPNGTVATQTTAGDD